LSVPAVGVFSA